MVPAYFSSGRRRLLLAAEAGALLVPLAPCGCSPWCTATISGSPGPGSGRIPGSTARKRP